MALIECPDCKRNISNSAKHCPECGWVNEKNSSELNNSSYGLFIASIVALAVGLVCVFCTVMCARWYYYVYWAIASGVFISASFYLLILDIALSNKQRKRKSY